MIWRLLRWSVELPHKKEETQLFGWLFPWETVRFGGICLMFLFTCPSQKSSGQWQTKTLILTSFVGYITENALLLAIKNYEDVDNIPILRITSLTSQDFIYSWNANQFCLVLVATSLAPGTVGLGWVASQNISRITLNHLYLSFYLCFVAANRVKCIFHLPHFVRAFCSSFLLAKARSIDIFDSDSTPRPGTAKLRRSCNFSAKTNTSPWKICVFS